VEQQCRANEEGATVAPAGHEVSKDDRHYESANSVPTQAQAVGQPQVFALEFSERESDSALSYTFTRPYAGFHHPDRMASDQTVRGGENDCFIWSRNFLTCVPKFSAFFRNPEFSGGFHGHQSGKSLAHADILHSSRNVKYKYGQVSKCSRINGGHFCIQRSAIFKRRASF
jgi:hypothetical protein